MGQLSVRGRHAGPMWTPVYYTKDTWRWDTAGSVDSGLVGDGIPSWFRVRLECIGDMSHEANWQLRFNWQHSSHPGATSTLSHTWNHLSTSRSKAYSHYRNHTTLLQETSQVSSHITNPPQSPPNHVHSGRPTPHLPLLYPLLLPPHIGEITNLSYSSLAKNSKGANARDQIKPRSPYA